MKTLIVILIIAALIQSSILPINLVLIILLSRSYIRADRANLVLAFAFGLLESHLNLNIWGLESIIYLILVEITEWLSKSRLAGNWFLIMPVTFVLLSGHDLVLSFFTHQSFQFSVKILIESLISLPVFYLVRFWEERFIVSKRIKLKV